MQVCILSFADLTQVAMDKQILSRDGPGAQSLEEEECGYHITRDKTNLSSSLVSTKCKVLLLIVGILIVIVAGAVVLAAVGTVEALRYNSHHADLMREERAAAINDPHFDSEPGAELVSALELQRFYQLLWLVLASD